jgi:hypothetical protein
VMLPSMLGDALGCLRDRISRDYLRATAPTLIGVLVHVTVVTRQITAAVHLQDELPERQNSRGRGQRR